MANDKKVNVIIKEKTGDGFVIKHPQTNFKMVEDVPNHASISGKSGTSSVTTPHNTQVNASSNSAAGMVYSQVNASSDSIAYGPRSQINASSGANISQQLSQINASSNARLSSEYSTISAATNASSNVKMSSIMTSKDTKLAATSTQNVEGITVLSSNDFEYDPSTIGAYKVIGGHEGQLSWMLDSKDGEIYAKDDVKIGDKSVSQHIEGKDADSVVEFTNSLSREVNASSGSTASGSRSQVNASHMGRASNTISQVNASGSFADTIDGEKVTFPSIASGPASQVNASYGSEASGKNSQVNASNKGIASGDGSQVNASSNSEASGKSSQINVSTNSRASGFRSYISASFDSSTNANTSAVIASANGVINDTDDKNSYARSMVMLASRNFEFDPSSANDHKVVGGYEGKLSWMLDSKNGEIYAKDDVKIGNKSVSQHIEGRSSTPIEDFTSSLDREVNASYKSTASRGRSQVNASSDSTASGLISQVNASYNSTASGSRSQVNASWNSEASENRAQVNASINSTVSGSDSQINASDGSEISGQRSQINASRDSTTSGEYLQVNASSDSEAFGKGTQINASYRSITNSLYSQVNASASSAASGSRSQVNASVTSTASGESSQINASKGVQVYKDYCVAGGYEFAAANPSSKNIKWMIESETGNIKATGSITGNSSFADFAEYMESESGEAIPLGTMVSMGQGQKIKIAQPGEFPVGVISATAGIILNAQGWEWKDRYLYDRYGQPIYVEKEVVNEKALEEMYVQSDQELKWDEFVQSLEDVPMKTELVMMENPKHVDDEEYIPRSERPEWNVVGMKGQIYVNIDDTVKEGDFIQVGANGIATKGNLYNRNWLVMEITTPYQEDLGHGIARVIV